MLALLHAKPMDAAPAVNKMLILLGVFLFGCFGSLGFFSGFFFLIEDM